MYKKKKQHLWGYFCIIEMWKYFLFRRNSVFADSILTNWPARYCYSQLMEQATPRACQRTNETPDAAGHSIYGGLYWWRQVVIPWVLNHAPQKWICLQTTLKYFLVPLFHFSFWHWDMRRVLLVHRFLEISVWKIYLHYFAKKKKKYFSDKYFRFF